MLAWKRRSLALVLVVAAFAFQFVPWIRIERATFAYHYLTAVIFAMIAVAYLVDELLRRPAWRDLAIGYLALAAVVGVLIFPLGSALPMPDWYINAARALPPWNFGFQFPDPPRATARSCSPRAARKLRARRHGRRRRRLVRGRRPLGGSALREPRARGGDRCSRAAERQPAGGASR